MNKSYLTDCWVTLGLGLLWGTAYMVTASPAPDEWDSVQFVFALDQFSLKEHQPHPPGYPLYVALAWLVRAIVGVANHEALTMVSACGGGLLVMVMYHVARLQVGRQAALLTALACGVMPAVWMSSVKAMSDAAASGTFLLVVVFVSGAVLYRKPQWLLGAAGVSALAIGLRPQNSFVILGLLVLAGFWVKLERRGWIVLIVIAVLGNLFWLLPTMAMAAHAAGDNFWTSYWFANDAQFRWRFERPNIYAVAAWQTDPFLRERFYHHYQGAFGFGLGLLNGKMSVVLWALLAGGWAGMLKQMFLQKLKSLREFVQLSFCWMVPYSLMIFVFLPGEQRYYIPVLAMLLAFAVMGWSAWQAGFTRYSFLPGLLLVVALGGVSLPLARQSHRESSPPNRAIEWLCQRVSPQERSRTLFLAQGSMRHLDFWNTGLRKVSLDHLSQEDWKKVLSEVDLIYAESTDLRQIPGMEHVTFTEVARFSRSEMIQRKHSIIYLYQVDGWQKNRVIRDAGVGGVPPAVKEP